MVIICLSNIVRMRIQYSQEHDPQNKQNYCQLSAQGTETNFWKLNYKVLYCKTITVVEVYVIENGNSLSANGQWVRHIFAAVSIIYASWTTTKFEIEASM